MARLAQSAERKALNLVVVGSSPTVGVLRFIVDCAEHALRKRMDMGSIPTGGLAQCAPAAPLGRAALYCSLLPFTVLFCPVLPFVWVFVGFSFCVFLLFLVVSLVFRPGFLYPRSFSVSVRPKS